MNYNKGDVVVNKEEPHYLYYIADINEYVYKVAHLSLPTWFLSGDQLTYYAAHKPFDDSTWVLTSIFREEYV